jgi:hypothetical protein
MFAHLIVQYLYFVQYFAWISNEFSEEKFIMQE